MDHRPDNVLSYGRKSSRIKAFLAANRRGLLNAGIAAIFLLMALGFFCGPTSGQIRLDTGDLRYCWWGLPLEYERMPQPLRSKLLALASEAPPISTAWATCVTYPLPTTNNTDQMYRTFYVSAAIWANEDPKIARWVMEDLVDDLGTPRPGHPMPWFILTTVDQNTGKVNADWRDDDGVKEYCSAHGYVPLPSAPAPAPK